MNLHTYSIQDTIVESMNSTIYRAVRQDDEQTVVIKTTSNDHPSFRDLARLKFEYEILRQLKIPGVIEARGFETVEGKPALLLEDFGGIDLAHYQKTGVAMAQFFSIAVKAASTLGGIHHRQIIHRDINPNNILINPLTNEVKIIDFSIASELPREKQTLRAASFLEGTLGYISPEQTGRMNRNVDYRTDYYSLGVTFFELLTGGLPFVAEDTMGMVHCHLSMRPPDPREINREIPVSLSRIILKLMEKNPEDRYQSAEGMVKDLERCRDAWKSRRSDEELELGVDDRPVVFRIPDQLYGREEEMAKLSSAFDRTASGNSEILLVAGHSGIGKSSLMQHIHAAVLNRNGYFVSGKFDQFERNVPFSAVGQAVKALVGRILAEPAEGVTAWQSRLTSALGSNGQLMTDIIPELETLLGPQQALPELDAEEVRHRVLTAFGNLLKACASEAHPLVLFLDDLQWSDASSIDLVLSWLEEEIPYLLIIGAYRDNEDLNQLAISRLLSKLEGDSSPNPAVALHRLSLGPLEAEAVTALVADTLYCAPAACRELSDLIVQKTQGNPYFIREFLQMLYQRKQIELDREAGRWIWHIEEIEKQSVSDNVVDLLVARLRSLPEETLEVLKLAASIGHRFDLKTLASVSKRPIVALATELIEPIQMGIILPMSRNYRLFDVAGDERQEEMNVDYTFHHDRVRQAAYSLIPEGERPKVHHRIGRVLRAARDKDKTSKRIFELVNHLNLGETAITDAEERLQLSRLNYRAGTTAKRSAAFRVAAECFEAGLRALSKHGDEAHAQLRFEHTHALAESLHISGEIEKSAAACESMFALAQDKIETGKAYIMRATIQGHEGRLPEVIDSIRKGLRLFDITLPETPEEIEQQIGPSIGQMQGYLAEHAVSELAELKEMSDAGHRLALEMLFRVIPAAMQTGMPLFVLIELMMFNLAVTHGTTPYASKNFVDCGIIQIDALKDYQRAYELGRIAFKIIDKYQAEHLRPSVEYAFSTFISYWGAHYEEALAHYERGHAAALETGDIEHLGYILAYRSGLRFYLGKNLEECELDIVDTIKQLEKHHGVNQLVEARITHWTIHRLKTMTPIENGFLEMSPEAFWAYAASSKNYAFMLRAGFCLVKLFYFKDDFEAAVKWSECCSPFFETASSRFEVPDFYLYYGLSLVRRYPSAQPEQREALQKQLEDHKAKLKQYADACPANFAHKHYLLAAEIERITGGDLVTVIGLYDKAHESIGRGEFLHMKAIINESQGRFWLENDKTLIAKAYITEAHALFRLWGAAGKAAMLGDEFDGWFGYRTGDGTRGGTGPTATSGSIEDSSMDMASILKATLAVSREIELERLLASLTTVLMENAGAEKCILLVKYDTNDAFVVEASGKTGEEIRVLQSQAIDENGDLCSEIVHLTARLRQPIVLNNAIKAGDFQSNRYVVENQIKSVLCLPMVNQDKLKAIVYLENNLTTHAFPPERVAVLTAIATPAAVTLENAFMYSHLDELVKQRTAELHAAQAEIAENAHKAGMSEIATTVLHNVGNVLNSLKTAGYVACETAKGSIVSKLLKANELLGSQMHNIDEFIADDPKGKKLLRYYLELGEMLNKENAYIVQNLTQILENTESISEIISAQQAYAYSTNSYSEVTPITEIIEHALTLNESSYSRHNIIVEKRLGKVPEIPLHKTKTLHIILNLLKNAKEAMTVNRLEDRKLLIDVHVEDPNLILTISDTGHGIAEADLSKIFSFGFTTKPDGHGSGLHSSANYMTEMGGRMWVESAGQGKGAAFTLSFPLA